MVAGETVIVVNTGVGVEAVTVLVAVPLLNPVLIASAVIVPAFAGFTGKATIPAALDVPLPLTPGPLRVTVAPFAAVFIFIILLDPLTVKDTLVDDPAGTEVGLATTDKVNVGNTPWQDIQVGAVLPL